MLIVFKDENNLLFVEKYLCQVLTKENFLYIFDL